jgi:hypothetical protein
MGKSLVFRDLKYSTILEMNFMTSILNYCVFATSFVINVVHLQCCAPSCHDDSQLNDWQFEFSRTLA